MPEVRHYNHASFTTWLEEGRLMGSRCAACGDVQLPPRSLCPRCFGTDMLWHEFSGRGVLTGFTAIYVGLPSMAAEGFSRERPYGSGVVRLKEGPSISAQILLREGGEDIKIGQPVRAVFTRRSGGETILAFEGTDE